MRITAIETYSLQSPLERAFGWSQGWIDTRSTGLIKIITGEGIVGWGEGADGAAATIVGKIFAPLLLGQDPTDRVGLWHKLSDDRRPTADDASSRQINGK